MRDIEALVKNKKEAHVRYRQLGSKVTKKINEGRVVDAVYMDFSKAFNKVLHGRLGQKTKEGEMEFNKYKSKVLHFAKSHQGRTYTINEAVRSAELFQQFLFSLVIENRSWNVMLQLYKTL
eukprot:g27123.t1